MNTNILDLSKIESIDLIKELKNRGYYTDLIMGIGDIDFQLDSINSDREDIEADKINITKEEKIEILENCFNTDYYSERLCEDLMEHILDNYDNN
jgi:hypothetical protein